VYEVGNQPRLLSALRCFLCTQLLQFFSVHGRSRYTADFDNQIYVP